jgi:acid phosphatase type 7
MNRDRRLCTVPAALLLLAACTIQPAHHQLPSPAPAATPSAAAPGTLLRFVAYGDTRTGHAIHQDIVDKVLLLAPAVVLQTGDLVFNGHSSRQWAKFDQITARLRAQVAYYPARGNHDCSRRYEARVTQPILSGNKLYYSFERSGIHFVSIDTQQSLTPGSVQYVWLESDLATAQKAHRFIVPFFHKAIFSIGQHSDAKDVQALKPILHPLFRSHGVTLAFQGHDHLYYRTQQDGITYVVTGGGGAPLYDKIREPGVGDVFEMVHHFCVADVTSDQVTVTVYRQNLSQVDRFTVPIKPPLAS